jgi:hypothetical protein
VDVPGANNVFWALPITYGWLNTIPYNNLIMLIVSLLNFIWLHGHLYLDRPIYYPKSKMLLS